MRYDSRYRYSSSFRSPFPNGVKWLLLANVAFFIANLLSDLLRIAGPVFDWLALTPGLVIHRLAIWQLVTYMFLHSTTDPMHILFNMLALWMFGSTLEQTWGTKRFLNYYFACGIGAGICVVIIALLFGKAGFSTVGASGAIFGLLLAFGLLFPDTTVFFFLFPIKAKYLVVIMGGLALFFSIRGGNGNVSNVAHLGGLAIGYVYLRLGIQPVRGFSLQERYRQWKIERAKRKFQVYLKKHDARKNSNKEPWVH